MEIFEQNASKNVKKHKKIKKGEPSSSELSHIFPRFEHVWNSKSAYIRFIQVIYLLRLRNLVWKGGSLANDLILNAKSGIIIKRNKVSSDDFVNYLARTTFINSKIWTTTHSILRETKLNKLQKLIDGRNTTQKKRNSGPPRFAPKVINLS